MPRHKLFLCVFRCAFLPRKHLLGEQQEGDLAVNRCVTKTQVRDRDSGPQRIRSDRQEPPEAGNPTARSTSGPGARGCFTLRTPLSLCQGTNAHAGEAAWMKREQRTFVSPRRRVPAPRGEAGRGRTRGTSRTAPYLSPSLVSALLTARFHVIVCVFQKILGCNKFYLRFLNMISALFWDRRIGNYFSTF